MEGEFQHAIEIEISMPCTDWLEIAGIEAEIVKSARRAFENLKLEKEGSLELSIVLGSDELVRDLNSKYRNIDKSTNVLSFPAGSSVLDAAGPRMLGDVVLAFETICGEARAQKKTRLNHACHLTVHGVLHLLNFSHDNDADAQHMERLEADILKTMGMPDPYESETVNADQPVLGTTNE